MSVLLYANVQSVSRPPKFGLARGLGTALLWLLAGVLVLLLSIPIPLLFLITAVPLPLAAMLTAVDIALLVLLFWLGRSWLLISTFFLGVTFVSALAVWLSQLYAYTPAIVDTQGQPLPNSIAVMETVELNGSQQWITIRSQNVNNPVLLFLAGGPGGSELPFVRHVLGGLEEHFVVVNWDQPGAGKSYGAVPSAQLTVDRFVADAHALSELLRTRFHQEKIYVMGESWGTVLGTLLVQKHPTLFYAYIGAGQRTSIHEDDVLGYAFALAEVAKQGNTELLEKLRRNGPPPYTGWNMALKNMDYLNVLNAYAREQADAEETGHDLMGDAFTGVEYGLRDRFNWIRGLWEGFTQVYPQLDVIDFGTQATKLDVPIYFLQGRWDLVEMSSLLERWYGVLAAPHKEIIYFENSGHTPHSWEPSKVVDVIVNRVLVEVPPEP